MRYSSVALLASSVFSASASARFVMYADEWHPTRPTNPADRAGIDHVVLAFAMANATAQFQPKVPITTIRSEYPNAKIMIAVGGWGDDIGFAQVSKSDATIAKFANDVATMLTNTGADGVDIDWEYPGGNGADYKQVPNSEKVYQIEAYPKTLAAIRTAIGSKLLSIAVPGKKGDMIGFTSDTGPKIWPSVDYINVMSYDLANRRDTVTKHHSSVAGSEDTVRNYLAIGAPPAKMNLGFAYYAKYFTTQGDCTANPLGCPIVLAEDPITGKDLLTSGAWTFETSHMKPVDSATLPISYDGTCGPDKGTKCSSGCCSQYGNCGNSPEHCSGACWHAFGVGCTDSDVAGSWQLAAKNGVTDEAEGGQYYFDNTNKLFWTWDTPELISSKFQNIVQKYKLGGVMAWSLGEDSYDWSHIRQMASELKRASTGGDNTLTPEADQAPRPSQTAVAAFDEATGQYTPVTFSGQRYQPRPTRRPPPKPPANPYTVVYVDGTENGPSNRPSNEPGSPADFSVDYNGGQPVKPAPYVEANGPPTASYAAPGLAVPYATPIVSPSEEQPYVSPAKSYVAPVDPYVAPAGPSTHAYPSPASEDISTGPVQPYDAPLVEPNASVDPYAIRDPKPTIYIDPILPVPDSDAAPVSPVDPMTPVPVPASAPTPLTQPYEPDFVPDPGYINPNWHPEAHPAQPAPTVAEVRAAVNAAAPAPAPAMPMEASDETKDGATWAQPVAHSRAKAAACRAKRHKKVKRGSE
ncbi:carbohydrate-binding module family 18 protein [Plenodomus tracheiphilus IPT5]|uniref:chitinase n=1 Tax=Plenodomus tracheiphilus IPT5 TaxID=1408161 RepID=A0A6A7BF86_9PLEO|nr:carbohydrate-binding module family 18 protein [Plenodomus tracheiphilus IPT5]